MIAAALIFAQAATQPAAAGETQRWSIMTDPCQRSSDPAGNEVVVCGRPEKVAPRIPLPGYRGPPDHPAPSNPDLSAATALDGPGIGTECGAYMENCEPFGGTYITPMTLVAGAVDVARRTFASRKYKNKGVLIPLDEPAAASMADRIKP